MRPAAWPTGDVGSIRIALAREDLASEEHGIQFGLSATLDLEGCDPAPN